MTTIVRHPNRGAHVRAGSPTLRALSRWYPGETLRSLGLLRTRWPRYPLITGGRPRRATHDWPSPDDGGAGRACA